MQRKSSGEEMLVANACMRDENQHSSQQPLILVVEDNADNMLLMRYALEPIGCKLICQTDCTETVLVAKEYQPDLILLDILLPGFSGMDVFRLLKQEPLTCNIPTIAVTALASAEDRERILSAGFSDYISKPYMIEDLEAMICRYLDGKLNFQFSLD